MVVIVFRSRLVPDVDRAAFDELDKRMYSIVSEMPGFVSERSYSSADGERLTVVEFESVETLEAWRRNPEHRAAQIEGRERFYAEYTNIVCEEVRRSSFKKQ